MEVKDQRLSVADIKDNSNDLSFKRGRALRNADAVHNIKERSVRGSTLRISGDVDGSGGGVYHAWIEYDDDTGHITDFECECPAYLKYPGMCKHSVALALKCTGPTPPKKIEGNVWTGMELLYNRGKTRLAQTTNPELANVIYQYAMADRSQFFQPEISGHIDLEPVLSTTYRRWEQNTWRVEFRIGAEKKYVLKDIASFLSAMENHEKVDYGKHLGFIHDKSAFTPRALAIIGFLKRAVGDYQALMDHLSVSYLYSKPQTMRYLELTDTTMAAFLSLLMGETILVDEPEKGREKVMIVAGNPKLSLAIQAQPDTVGQYALDIPPMTVLARGTQLFLMMDAVIYQCDEDFSAKMDKVCTLAYATSMRRLSIVAEDMPAFCAAVVPLLREHTDFEETVDLEEYTPGALELRIYLDVAQGYVSARLEGRYGKDTFNLLETVQPSHVFRDIAHEQAALNIARSYFSQTSDNGYLVMAEDDDEHLYHLLDTGVEQLATVGELYISDSFKKYRVGHGPKITVGVSLSVNLIDLQVDTGFLAGDELLDYLASFRQRKKFHRMKNGEFITMEDNGLESLMELTDGLDLDAAALAKGAVSIPRYQAFYLEQVLKEEATDVAVNRDKAFKAMIRNFKSVEDSDYEVPQAVETILRSYQKTGFRWLCTMAAMGFGGILADDMGLGKTLQVLTYLLWHRGSKDKSQPTIIVCPASLVYNWQSEIEKFTPCFSVAMVTGSAAVRKAIIDGSKACDILITSYDLLKRDVHVYGNKRFEAIVIDEAQYIKNHTTKAAKAVKAINAGVHLALTGTPIENRLSELWSIFDFLMPGYLGRYESFREDYERPITTSQDEVARERLKRKIKPFILRRLKQDVLKDLPDKEENIVYSRLEGEQYKLYQARVLQMKATLAEQSEVEIKTGKLQILSELTRLRQICCVPAMVYENYKGPAAKVDTCMDLIQSAVDGDHKILVFSQFTSVFPYLETAMDKAGIAYYKLTGATAKAERMALVRAFNTPGDETSVFLISLKAGGTGLNLTAADIIIHFDPWWNVAAQNQATDRVHRIGQKNTVSVFKLIARDTLEEKIMDLQEAKKDLSDQIIGEGGISVANLTRDDFMGLLE